MMNQFSVWKFRNGERWLMVADRAEWHLWCGFNRRVSFL